VWIHVPSTACDVIDFNGPGQLCPLTCAEWSYLSNNTRMSTIQSRTPEKNAKDYVTLNQKFPWKSCSTTHPPFLLSNPKILKAFPKTFPTKMKPTKCTAKEKKWSKKSDKRGEERKWKVKVKTAELLLYPKAISEFCFLCMPEIRKLIFCIWLRRAQGEWPVNGFIVSFSSLIFYSTTVTRKPLD